MTTVRITRHFIAVDQRTVHLRRAGQGPVVLLVHGSPQSGAALTGLIEEIARAGFTAIAPDTPGNGLSDPLPHAPRDAALYGQALAHLLTALGVERCAAYGFHTGAACAAALAALFPARVSALVLDGLPVWTTSERARLLASYLPVNPPRADGGHLNWLWTRAEDQAIFFPWFDRSARARMPGRTSPPDPAATHEVVLDFLRAGDAYRAPYAAAFHADGEALLSRIRAPTLLCASENDPLFAHLDRVRDLPANIEIGRHGAQRADAWKRITACLSNHAAGGAPSLPALPAYAQRGFVVQGAHDVHWRGATSTGETTLLLHDAGASSRDFATALETPGRLAIDLPGHGETKGVWAEGDDGLATAADIVAGVLNSLGLDRVSATGVGLGARVAERLKLQTRLAAVETLPGAGLAGLESVPSLDPRADGAHLLAAWSLARRRALAMEAGGEAWRDLQALHRAATDLVLCGASFAPAFRTGV